MSVRTKHWPILYKRTNRGEIQIWKITAAAPVAGPPVLTIVYGLEDGKQTTTEIEIAAGKNAGRRNATDPWTQALSEGEARWVKQQARQGYGVDLDAAVAARGALPMLAKDFTPKQRIDWSAAFMQPKLDGWRCRAALEDGQVVLRSKKNTLITSMPHIAAELGRVLTAGEVLDGELYRHGMSRQKIASLAGTRTRVPDGADQLEFHCFDVVSADRFALRYQQLRQTLSGQFDHLRLVPTARVSSLEDVSVCEHEYLAAGHEGGILRHGRTGYEAGVRTAQLLKIKRFVDDEFEVVDVRKARDSTHKNCAIFVCRTAAGHYFDVEAPGTLEEKQRYWETATEWIGRLLVVKYQAFSVGEAPKPIHPTAIAFRDPAE